MLRFYFYILNLLFLACVVGAYFFWPSLWFLSVLVGAAVCVGWYDILQTKKTVLRNFPILGHFRYMFEFIRPEIQQYFVESNTDGVPISRELRSIVYQRAKAQLDTLPFGTQLNVYEEGYEWFNHSMMPTEYSGEDFRVKIGGRECDHPYSASILNISAMSYGALSKTAVLALNHGAKLGNFYHNTGEGSISPYHLEPGGDLVWQVGTGYFGCRTKDGNFDGSKFKERANHPQVKMIEIKLSQGAKPGHGGILPGRKVTEEIAKIRGTEVGETVVSPPFHRAFSDNQGLLRFIQNLRELSGGKPIGFKLCVGLPEEFVKLCELMLQENIYPDFITVDGGEGGTGAAPLEFSNRIGTPLREGLIFVHNTLVGYGLRERIKVISSGKVITGFDLLSHLALGADLCNSARAMMLALGCIQALRCNSNICPTGVATQKPELYNGLSVPDKKVRVYRYHRETIKSAGEILAAMGLKHPDELSPAHLMKRVSFNEVKSYAQLYNFVESGTYLKKSA